MFHTYFVQAIIIIGFFHQINGQDSQPHRCENGKDGFPCDAKAPDGTIVVYSAQERIAKFNNLTKQSNELVRNNAIVDALTAAQNFIYWSSRSNNFSSIFKKSINDITENASQQELIGPNHNITLPITSIAIDWINDKIYFTWDKFLFVCSGDGKLYTKLKDSNVSISSAALAPKHGLLFWTQNDEAKNQAKILRSAMDGSDETIFLEKSGTNFESLVFDEAVQRLYWVDTIGKAINFRQFDRTMEKVERFEAPNLFSLAAFENQLYWTLKGNATVIVHSPDRDNTTTLIDNKNETNGRVYVYNPILQHTKIQNPCSSASCNGLCLTRLANTQNLNFNCLKCEENNSTIRWCSKSKEEVNITIVTTTNSQATSTTTNNELTTATTNSQTTSATTNSQTTSATTNNENPLPSTPKVEIKTPESRKGESGGMGKLLSIIIVVVALALLGIISYFGFKWWSQGEEHRNIGSVLFKRNTTNNTNN